jgi:DNA mismatch repair protein MutL
MTELQPHLAECGFSLTELSGNSWALRGAPAMLGPEEARGLLLALSTEDEPSGGAIDVRDRLLHALAASMSCRAAIKIHHPLTTEEMEVLVQELFEADQPYACPHGRPVVLEMTDRDLERRFGRR